MSKKCNCPYWSLSQQKCLYSEYPPCQEEEEMKKISKDDWLKGLEWEKARDLAVDWYLPIFSNDHKKIRELEKRIRKLENKKETSDFYITVACDGRTMKERNTAEIIEILQDEFRAAISVASRTIEGFKKNGE